MQRKSGITLQRVIPLSYFFMTSAYTDCLLLLEPTKYELRLATTAPKAHTRKKVVATANRREGACNRAGEPSELSCGRGGARERADVFFEKEKRSKAHFAPTW